MTYFDGTKMLQVASNKAAVWGIRNNHSSRRHKNIAHALKNASNKAMYREDVRRSCSPALGGSCLSPHLYNHQHQQTSPSLPILHGSQKPLAVPQAPKYRCRSRQSLETMYSSSSSSLKRDSIFTMQYVRRSHC